MELVLKWHVNIYGYLRTLVFIIYKRPQLMNTIYNLLWDCIN